MDVPPPEYRRVKITSDIQSKSSTKLQHLGTSHPFTRQACFIARRYGSPDSLEYMNTVILLCPKFQVDILFPSSDIFESALCKLSTRYLKGQVKLADLVHSSGAFADFYSQPQRCFTMLSNEMHSDDVWCIDPRGLLTLLVTKDTYERLGLVGTRLPFKAHRDYFVIRLPLQKNAESVGNRARRDEALKAWDARREREGLGAWSVVYCFNDSSLPEPTLFNSEVREVVCQTTKSSDVHIPSPSLRQHPSTSQTKASGPSVSDRQQDDDDVEDWDAEMATLFEWVGMASSGSQRLKANDRVDPYVALYEHPSPSYVGSVTRLRWSGLIGRGFLQSAIDVALATMKTLPVNDTSETVKPFVAITAHSCSTSPASYIPPSASIADGPTRLARSDGEDTWCLFATPGAGEPPSIDFALVESLGQYDTRWG